MTDNIVEIPQDITFELPIGVFPAQLSSLIPAVRSTKTSSQNWIRMLFKVAVPGLKPHVLGMAGRNFLVDMHRGSDLRNFLDQWLGKDYLSENHASFNLNSLIGKTGVISLSHYQNPKHESPLVTIQSIRPIGTCNAHDHEETIRCID